MVEAPNSYYTRGSGGKLGGAGRGTCRPGSACASAAPGLDREERGADRKSWPRQDRTQRKEGKTVGLRCRAGQGRAGGGQSPFSRRLAFGLAAGLVTPSAALAWRCFQSAAPTVITRYVGKYYSSNTPYSSDARALQSIEAKRPHCEAATRITSACANLRQLSDKAGITTLQLSLETRFRCETRAGVQGSRAPVFSRGALWGRVWAPAQDAPCPGGPAGTPGGRAKSGCRSDRTGGRAPGSDGMGLDLDWIDVGFWRKLLGVERKLEVSRVLFDFRFSSSSSLWDLELETGGQGHHITSTSRAQTGSGRAHVATAHASTQPKVSVGEAAGELIHTSLAPRLTPPEGAVLCCAELR